MVKKWRQNEKNIRDRLFWKKLFSSAGIQAGQESSTGPGRTARLPVPVATLPRTEMIMETIGRQR